ncbi:MAG: glycogen debranching enzyme N-terminal domain-containing protein, partial [bacterium]
MHPFEAAEFSHDNSPFDRLTRREWLAVNGIGGFASGTISGANSRRYHALLVAALPSPYGRMTLLSRVEETVAIGSQKYELSSNRYANGAVYPDGWRYVSEFSVWPV